MPDRDTADGRHATYDPGRAAPFSPEETRCLSAHGGRSDPVAGTSEQAPRDDRPTPHTDTDT